LSEDDVFLVRDEIERLTEAPRPVPRSCDEEYLKNLLVLGSGPAKNMIASFLFHQATGWLIKIRRRAEDEGAGADSRGRSGGPSLVGEVAKNSEMAMRKLRDERAELHKDNKPAVSGQSRLPSDRVAQLRQTFESAVRRLEAIPETELSPSGQPFIKECADAMLAFAAWFGEQTPDDLAILGNAHRVHYALLGLSGVIDWVALRWSVPFAHEVGEDITTLAEEADAFDNAVMKAHKVAEGPGEIRFERRSLSDRIYADFEERIQRISSLASRLGSRLQRLAAWAPETHPSARPKALSCPRATSKRDLASGNAVAKADQPVIKLGPPGEPCRVFRKEKGPLTDGQYAVISRLLKAGSAGLSKDALEAVRPSARRILKTLRKDPDWAKVILMPGQTNGRYRLKM
jgi:hypothetical protein